MEGIAPYALFGDRADAARHVPGGAAGGLGGGRAGATLEPTIYPDDRTSSTRP